MKKNEILPTISFSEYSYINEHKRAFSKSELGILHSLIPFSELEKALFPRNRKEANTGRPSHFSNKGKIALMILKSKYNMSDKSLIERLNTDVSFQLFSDTIISAHNPLTDFKIVSRIRTEMSNKLSVMHFQKVIADALRPHVTSNDLRVVMSDATCYESHLRFPTNQKLLNESILFSYKTLIKLSHLSHQRTPRTKYIDVISAYGSFSKTRKKTHKKKLRITRRLLSLLEKIVSEICRIMKSKRIKLNKRDSDTLSKVKRILVQQKDLFNGIKVSNRIVSISKPYIRPIVRGKETKMVEFGAKVNSIQVGGFNFIEHIDFNAFHEGIRVAECITLHKMLFKIKPLYFAGDALYATNKNRSYCKANHIKTNFVPKGRQPKIDNGMRVVRRELNIARSTILEGSFGTEKEHYSLRKIKARTKKNEILWILFGIHTANFSRLASRIFKAKPVLKTAA